MLIDRDFVLILALQILPLSNAYFIVVSTYILVARFLVLVTTKVTKVDHGN